MKINRQKKILEIINRHTYFDFFGVCRNVGKQK